ncbi:MAG: YitT family protein [Lachnospiraceae bacterium]|nr:YitT family protein [Lachnospiraceae bacterium]
MNQRSAGKDIVSSFIFITIGAVLAAFSLEEFLVPNHIYDGGVTGVAMIVAHFTPAKLGYMVALFNLPFVILAWKRLGHVFVMKFFYAIALFSTMTVVFEPLENATNDIILAVTFGGVLLGTGVGLVLRGGGCLDGTETVAVILNRVFSVSIGQTVLICNIVIYAVAGYFFGIERGMYSLLMYFITSKVIDIVEIGMDSTKSVMIITDDGAGLAQRIFEDLGRTVTFLRGKGLVSSEGKDILYCVVTRAEIYDLKRIIEEEPGSTFTTISEVSEIVGNHIKSSEVME